MSDEKQRQDPEERLVNAYDRMMERAKGYLERTEKRTVPVLREAIDKAQETAVELGELTRDESAKIAAYLRRDLHDAGEFLAETGEGLANWLRFDIQYIEDRMWILFSSVADQSRLEMLKFQERLKTEASTYHTGQVAGIGSFRCLSCGQTMDFKKTGPIPPCPRCHGTDFMRVTSEKQE